MFTVLSKLLRPKARTALRHPYMCSVVIADLGVFVTGLGLEPALAPVWLSSFIPRRWWSAFSGSAGPVGWKGEDRPSQLARPAQRELGRSCGWDLAAAWVLLVVGVVVGAGVTVLDTVLAFNHRRWTGRASQLFSQIRPARKLSRCLFCSLCCSSFSHLRLVRVVYCVMSLCGYETCIALWFLDGQTIGTCQVERSDRSDKRRTCEDSHYMENGANKKHSSGKCITWNVNKEVRWGEVRWDGVK